MQKNETSVACAHGTIQAAMPRACYTLHCGCSYYTSHPRFASAPLFLPLSSSPTIKTL